MTDVVPFHQIASRFYNRPLLLTQASAETISAFLLQRVAAGGRSRAMSNDGGEAFEAFPSRVRSDGTHEYHSTRASRFYGETPVAEGGRPEPYRRTLDGTAIITSVGEFVNRGAWVGASSGLISYEGYKFSLERAATDQRARAIVLDLESPGGEAVGAFECAAVVRKVAAIKPVIAVINGMACSAAYAIASGASRIVTMPTGLAGSIGVVMMHLDLSKYLEDEGVKPTLIFAGAHKVDGNPYEPLPEDVRGSFQREVDSFYSQFVGTVTLGRKKLNDKKVRDTQAQTYKGQDAVDAGLADSVGTLEDVLAEVSRGQTGRSLSMKGTQRMDATTQGAPVAEATGTTIDAPATITSIAALVAAYPALCATMQTEAADRERSRILAIDSAAMPGHDVLIAAHKADPSKSAGDAALAMLAADKTKGSEHLAKLAADETKVADLSSQASQAPGKVEASPHQVAAQATAYKNEQESKGLRVSTADAVAFVRRSLGMK